jgi:hypothetical protein
MNRNLRLRRIRQRMFGIGAMRGLTGQNAARHQKQYKHAKPGHPLLATSVRRGDGSTSGGLCGSTLQKNRAPGSGRFISRRLSGKAACCLIRLFQLIPGRPP